MTVQKTATSGKARAKARNAQVVKLAGQPGHILGPRDVPRRPWRVDLVDPIFSFVVYGVPAPQGSKKAQGYVNGRVRLAEASDYLAPWRTAISAMATKAIQARVKKTGIPWTGISEPVMVSAGITVPATDASTRRGDVYSGNTPDLDKLERAIGDALSPTPLKPSDGKGYGDAAKKKLREEMMAQRRKTTILHDDAVIASWDHVTKVYPAMTVNALGYSGVIIQVWLMAELDAAAARPVKLLDGVEVMSAADLRAWGRPTSGETWEEASVRLWAAPHVVLAARGGVVQLRGRGLRDEAVCAVLAALAVDGPSKDIVVEQEPLGGRR